MSYTIEWQPPRVVVTYDGDSGAADVLNAVVAMQADPRFTDVAQALHDFSRCTALEAGLGMLEEIAGRNYAAAFSQPRLRIAVIPDDAPVRRMLSSFAGIGVSPFPIRAFATRREAETWLAMAR